MTLAEVTSLYSTDEHCRNLLVKLRWPTGIRCLRCKSEKVYDLPTQKKFECGKCAYQFSVLTRTIFNGTHLPLQTWFAAVVLLENPLSTNKIKDELGISYKTAWFLCHRIRKARAEAYKPIPGVSLRGTHSFHAEMKIDKDVMIAIRHRDGNLHFFHAEDCRSGTVAKFMEENISRSVKVRDMLEPLCLLKRRRRGRWKKISTFDLAAYLRELFWLNHWDTPDLFIVILGHLITADLQSTSRSRASLL
jgi:transposase-like protein